MPRRVLIIVIALAALIIPAVVLLFVVDRSPTLQNVVQRVANSNGSTNGNTNAPTNKNAPVANPDQPAVIYVARNFAEVYGSGNNQNDFANLVASQDWGTRSFNDFVNRTIAQSRLTNSTTPYHSIVTKAVVMKVTRLLARQASVTVNTQRVETLDTKETVYYQDLFLDLVKEGDNWKINAASWAPRT